MYIVNNYPVAVMLCFITMLCWGSWGNTQKLAARTWRYELFYWDYVIGIVLLSAAFGLTLGSIGNQGRSFLPDLAQIDMKNIISAFAGGIIFNASNILLSAAVALAGMAVAFPIGVGLALVLGVFINFWSAPKGDPVILFSGVALVMVAIVLNGIASGKLKRNTDATRMKNKGILIAVLAGILMSFFFRFVASAMDLENFEHPAAGMATPYSAFFIFSLGILASNFLFNTLAMRKPVTGKPVSYKQYFKGNLKTHLVGVLGGIIWGIGTVLSYIAAGKAGAAISYALGQGAPIIAALWGIFIWKEFKGGPKINTLLLSLMMIFFLGGIVLIIYSGN